MSDIAVAADRGAWRAAPRGDARDARGAADARRVLQLALAGLWLLDGVLQYQAFMFSKGFSQMMADTAAGNPHVVADPITWNATFIEHHLVLLNAIFAAI